MKLKHVLTLLLLYGFWIVCFAIQKPLFMIVNWISDVTIKDWFEVITHGLKLDVCFAAYFCFVPLILLLINVFVKYNISKVLYLYNIILGVIVTIIFSVDCILYSYWGFRIDATLMFYLKDFGESLNSVTAKDILKFILIFGCYMLIIAVIYRYTIRLYLHKSSNYIINTKYKFIETLLLVVCLPILIIATRGGVSTATANIGMVYYCNNQKLNQAAINPTFSLISSLMKNEDFSNRYIFMDDKLCKQTFEDLLAEDSSKKQVWITKDKPNIIIVLLESFTANVVGAVNGEQSIIEDKEVTPNLNLLAKESIVFDSCFSNAMRTDRGVVSVLTGFLAQPDMSIIKYPEKTRSLPTMAKALHQVGYQSFMLYGGDINFANMRSYFYGSMYDKVIDYKVFNAKYRLSKWGVRDEHTFDYFLSLLKKQEEPFFASFLTLSSHEPFDVSLHKFTDKYINSVAYADSCIGMFIKGLKQTKLWENSLIVFVADHGYTYPRTLANTDKGKYHIPLLITGGVIKQPMHIKRLVNQTDIPKTILNQLNIDTKDFIYSRDVLNPSVKNYAFYVYTNGFGFIDSTGYTIWDNDMNKAIENHDKQRERKGKALLQTLYRDISSR